MKKASLSGRTALCGSFAIIGVLAPLYAASAQTAPAAAPSTFTMGEIVVTAQKREQSINAVGMSINAVTGEALTQRGVTSVGDLTKVVPGFSYTPSPFQEPVYVLRGVGLYDSGLGSSPAVTVYLDQIPLPYPIMTEVAPLDLQRVEALKGPQGTLFGQNSTGGAINYIAAKPTNTFEAGTDLTYARFNQVQADGFVSGPLTDTLKGRLSLGTTQGGAWQYSLTRPGDHLGNSDVDQGRLLLDWRPTSKLKFELNVNGFYDGSDTQAQQLIAVKPADPALASAALLASPIAPANARAADWPAGVPLRSNDSFFQIALRSDYEINPDLTLTSLSNYEYMNVNKRVDITGTAAAGELNLLDTVGHIEAASQELRLSGHTGPAIWTIGGNYDYAGITDGEYATVYDTADQPLSFLPPFHNAAVVTHQTVDDYAVFGNVDYKLPAGFTAHVGLRATQSDRQANSCSFDPDSATDGNSLGDLDTTLQDVFALEGLKKTPVTPVRPGACTSLTPAPQLQPTAIDNHLNENNLASHLGLDYTFQNGALLYVSDSIGYKSGLISPVLASSTTEANPVKQERLHAYEVGVKTPLFNHAVHLNLASFYYSYNDQQLRTHYDDPEFGLLEQLVNIPKSQIWGLDGSLQARPIHGLDLSVSGTYLESDVTKGFSSFNAEGTYGDFKGSQLPYTPKVEIVADAQYQWPVASWLNAFAGASLTYHGSANATFNSAGAPAPLFKLDAYTVLDLRGGVATPDGLWRVTGFAHNVTNDYYWTSVEATTDTVYRTAGMPLSFGVTLSHRWR